MFAKLAGRLHVGVAMMLVVVVVFGGAPQVHLHAAARGPASVDALAVTTTADRVDGNTASFAALLSNPGADAQISLREALRAANNTPFTTTLKIIFDLPSNQVLSDGTLRIQPDARLGSLPPLARGSVIIDALSSPPPGIITLDGAKNTAIGDGLTITSADNQVRGLVIANFLNSGIVLRGNAADNLIADSQIERNHTGVLFSGTDVTRNQIIGSTIADNEAAAVELAGGAHANLIGGDGAQAGNTIRDNDVLGVYIHGSGTNANVLEGNTLTGHVSSTSNPAYPVWINDRVQQAQILRNVIAGNQYGIRIDGSSNNVIAGNWIGTASGGLTKQPNSEHGVMLFTGANNNVVGGSTPGTRNVIAGNGKYGVYIYASSGNNLRGNYIGVGGDGVTAVGNGQTGVWLRDAAENTVEANVIAANGGDGIKVDGPRNVVVSNRIGVAANGSTPLPNAGNGLSGNGNDIVIGPANIISNHAQSGILASGRGVKITGNTVESNRRGMCSSGADALISGNTVRFNGAAGSGACGVENGGIIAGGGQALITDNIIHSNTGAGVVLLAGNGNSVLTNSITDNSSAGIALTPGVNDELAAPTIASVQATSIDGTSCANCAVELFTDDDDEGRTFLGETTSAADGSFSVAIEREMLSGTRVSATATDANGNTSAFAKSFRIPPAILPNTHQAFFPFVGN